MLLLHVRQILKLIRLLLYISICDYYMLKQLLKY